jgi:hypothetical protein
MMVAAGCLILLVANGLVFKEATAAPALPILQVITVISLLWIVAAAWGVCRRNGWMRYMLLTILYAGSIGFFLTAIITLATVDGPLVGRVGPIFIATAAYIYVSLVFTHSKHVKRLSSRAWE